MHRDEETKPEDLNRPDGNDLQSNYQKHDIGEAETIERLDPLGCRVEGWGIDMRNDGGDDGIIYDDKMDFKVTYNEELVALIDVKTKGSPKYMGRFNERHYSKYYGHAKEFDVPVFVVMYQVDYGDDAVHDEFVFELTDTNKYDDVISSEQSDAVSRFPDGNHAVLIPHGKRKTWRYLSVQIRRRKSRIIR